VPPPDGPLPPTLATMKSHRALIALVLTLAALNSRSQGSTPADWLLMPYAASVNSCAAYGTDMRIRLKETLVAAQRNSVNVLPASAWDLIGQGLSVNAEKAISPAEAARCNAVLALFQDPSFSKHVRQGVAAQFIMQPALHCMAAHPSTIPIIKSAWLSAFKRQEFTLTEKAVDDLASHAAQQTKKPTTGDSPSLAECERFARDLNSTEFDARFGEAGVLKLLSGNK
jgi:hypothetical protein